MGEVKLLEPRFLRGDKLWLGEFVVRSQHDRQRRAPGKTRGRLHVELRRQKTGVKYDAIRVDIPPSHPPCNSRRALGKAEHPQSHPRAIYDGEYLAMEGVKIIHVIIDLELPILGSHPAGADGGVRWMWAANRRREVIARERFRSNKEAVASLEGQETREKASGQLPMTMADDPHFRQSPVECAHNGVARRPRDLKVALLEGAVLFFLRGRDLQ